MRHWGRFVLVVVTAALSQSVESKSVQSPWQVIPRDESHNLRDSGGNRIAKIAHAVTLSLNESMIDWTSIATGEQIRFPLVLPNGDEVVFDMTRSQVMHPELQARFPEIVALTGTSVGYSRKLHAHVDYSPRKGFRGYIKDSNDDFYLDPLDSSWGEKRVYKSYSSKDMFHGGEPWSCTLRNHTLKDKDGDSDEHEPVDPEPEYPEYPESRIPTSGRRLSEQVPVMEHQFTMAMVANGEYSLFHGNTVESVLAEIVTVMNRVNGVYKRELGVFFQLHKDTDKLICLHPCDLSNAYKILDETDAYIQSKGVDASSYDIGHSLTTASGGLACVASLCTPYKTCGTTGLRNPTSDAFYIDYVSHEIGHQLAASHTFQDCDGLSTSNLDVAVEPGSGSSILSYAGICGNHNLQSHSDPYFHASSLEQMMNFVQKQQQLNPSCGTKRQTESLPPTVKMPEQCTVPVNNFFRLSFGNPNSGQDLHEYYYSIDSVTSSPDADLLDTSVPKFRTWVPTTRPYRDFPNMYYILHGLSSVVLDEVLPKETTTMTFRGTVRRVFFPDAQLGDGSASEGFGAFAYQDSSVHFDASIAPLRLHEISSTELVAGEPFRIAWDVGGTQRLASELDLYVSLETLPFVGNSGLDYDQDVNDLHWIKIAQVANTGSANVLLPSSLGNHTQDLHVMLRSPQDSCYFFDVLAKVPLNNKTPYLRSRVPTPAPSAQPTRTSFSQKTVAPTPSRQTGSGTNLLEDLDNIHLSQSSARNRQLSSMLTVIVLIVALIRH